MGDRGGQYRINGLAQVEDIQVYILKVMQVLPGGFQKLVVQTRMIISSIECTRTEPE